MPLSGGAIEGITVAAIIVAAVIATVIFFVVYKDRIQPQIAASTSTPPTCLTTDQCPVGQVCGRQNTCNVSCRISTDCTDMGFTCVDNQCIPNTMVFGINSSTGTLYSKVLGLPEITLGPPKSLDQTLTAQPWSTIVPVFLSNSSDARISDILPIQITNSIQTGQQKRPAAIIVRASDNKLYWFYNDNTTDTIPSAQSLSFAYITYDTVKRQFLANDISGSLYILTVPNNTNPLQAIAMQPWTLITTTINPLTSNPQLSRITVGRPLPGLSASTRNYFATLMNFSNPVLYQSQTLKQWFPASTSTTSTALTSTELDNYFSVWSLAYNPFFDSYIVSLPNSAVCQTTSTLGSSSSSGGTIHCIDQDSSVPVDVIRYQPLTVNA